MARCAEPEDGRRPGAVFLRGMGASPRPARSLPAADGRRSRAIRGLGRGELAIRRQVTADPGAGRAAGSDVVVARASTRCESDRLCVVRLGSGRLHPPDPFVARRGRRAERRPPLPPHRQPHGDRRATAHDRSAVRHQPDHRSLRSDEPFRRRPRRSRLRRSYVDRILVLGVVSPTAADRGQHRDGRRSVGSHRVHRGPRSGTSRTNR